MRSQPSDDGILRLLLPLCLQYLDEFAQSELLSRRLGHLCCKKLGYMLSNIAEANLITSPQSESTKTEQKDNEKEKKEVPAANPMQSTLLEYQNCPHHRDIGITLD
jgi:mediator of RNA polymerase II transcription subunit 12